MGKVIKKREWAFILYPESAVPDWLEQLRLSGLRVAISPLHDKDVNVGEEGNEPKKPHHHIILIYDGPTTLNSVQNFIKTLRLDIDSDSNKNVYAKPLESVRGYYRYLTHEDNPEKYHYDEKDIVLLNHFDVNQYIQLSSLEVDAILDFIDDFIREFYITDYGVLIYRLGDLEDKNYKRIARSHTLHCRAMCNTMRHGIKRDEEGNLIVEMTGETL